MTDGSVLQFGHVNLMLYGVNRNVIFQALRLNQYQYDLALYHVLAIHHNFSPLKIDTDNKI